MRLKSGIRWSSRPKTSGCKYKWSKKTAHGQAGAIQDEVGLLDEHLPDGRGRVFKVIGGPGIGLGRSRRSVFQVREIDVDNTRQTLDDLGLLVAVGVPDERDAQPVRVSESQRPQDGDDDVRRRDEVDVRGPVRLEAEHG
jgi:hypothetical protein